MIDNAAGIPEEQIEQFFEDTPDAWWWNNEEDEPCLYFLCNMHGKWFVVMRDPIESEHQQYLGGVVFRDAMDYDRWRIDCDYLPSLDEAVSHCMAAIAAHPLNGVPDGPN